MRDIYQEVTDQIVAELEAGTPPWVQPWKTSATADLPHNAASGRPYTGTNVLLLWITAGARGYRSAAYCTFKQAKAAGGHVRKGERGTRIVYASKFTKEVEGANGETETVSLPFLKAYTVFNVDQCEGVPADWTPEPETVPLPLIGQDDTFAAVVRSSRAVIRHKGGEAFYVPSQDYIQMPDPLSFDDTANYKATLLHELSHWTGHKTRLNRDLTGRFRTQAYAAEELIAELSAAFLCARLGIRGELRHASYIDNWLGLLRSDKRAIFTAAARAQEAADFLADAAEQPIAEAA